MNEVRYRSYTDRAEDKRNLDGTRTDQRACEGGPKTTSAKGVDGA